MAEHDYIISNQTFPSTRTDINNALSAIATMNAKATAPSTTYAGLLWIDTANSLLKQRNQADSVWIIIGVIDKDGFVNTYAGNPNGNVAGNFKGELTYDTSNNKLYFCTTTGVAASAVWELVTSGGGTTSYPKKYVAGPAPVWASAATLTLASIDIRNVDNDGNIVKTGSSTINIANAGILGVLQSANLTGTVSVTLGSAAVTGSGTGFVTDFQVGDVIMTAGGQGRRITVITDTVNMTVESNFSSTESGVTFKRGGEAPNTHYYLYGIDDGSTPGAALSTRNVAGGDTLVDLPSGYVDSSQYAFALRNDSAGDIIPFMVGAGWPQRPEIHYTVNHAGSNTTVGPTNVLDGGTATAFTDVDLSAFIPPISRFSKLKSNAGSATVATGNFRKNGDTSNGMAWSNTATGSVHNHHEFIFDLETDSSQLIEYKKSGSAVDIAVVGYTVTEVA